MIGMILVRSRKETAELLYIFRHTKPAYFHIEFHEGIEHFPSAQLHIMAHDVDNEPGDFFRFSEEDAKKVIDVLTVIQKSTVNFVLLVNCEAGKSRSAAVGEYVARFLDDRSQYDRDNPGKYPNTTILNLLTRNTTTEFAKAFGWRMDE